MKVGDVIINAKGKRRIIVGRTPDGSWVVKPFGGYVLDMLSPEVVAKSWKVVEYDRR